MPHSVLPRNCGTQNCMVMEEDGKMRRRTEDEMTNAESEHFIFIVCAATAVSTQPPELARTSRARRARCASACAEPGEQELQCQRRGANSGALFREGLLLRDVPPGAEPTVAAQMLQ